MEENTTVQNESEELAAETLAAFDDGWDDKDEPELPDDGQDTEVEESDEPDTDSESEEAEADANQQEAEEPEGGEAAEETKAEGDEGTPYPDVTIKYLSKEEVISGKDVVEYVQKGRDYDRIKPKWDGVKDILPMYQSEHAFLQELAENRGGDIAGLMDETRIRMILAEAEANGEDMSPAEAAARAVKMRMDGQYGAGGIDPEAARQEKSQQEVARFLEKYPDVKAEDIPKEVWDDVSDENGANGDLLGAYQRYENRKLKEEIKQLKKELAGNAQQKKNKARSTGSTKSVGSSAGRDAFDEGWDAAY